MASSAKPFFPISGLVGADFNSASTDQKFELGQTARGNSNTDWLYVQAGGAIDKHDLVTVDEDFSATAATASTAAAGHSVAVATGAAIAASSYGWVCRAGSGTYVKVNAAASTAADALLNATATAGHVGNASSGVAIEGIVLTTAASASAGSLGAIINYPRTTES